MSVRKGNIYTNIFSTENKITDSGAQLLIRSRILQQIPPEKHRTPAVMRVALSIL